VNYGLWWAVGCRSVLDERLYPDGSWWSKFDRAQCHLENLQGLVAPYTAGRKHPVTSQLIPDSEPKTWEYRVWFEGKVDPIWSVVAGDFLFNTRAALDHMIIALNPPEMKDRLIYFPIYGEDPWRRDPRTRCYVQRDPLDRHNFTEAVKRLHPTARAYIKGLQPYAASAESGNDVSDHVLAILKRLNNIDKHRRLLATRSGCNGARIRYPLPSGEVFEGFYEFPPGIASADGAVILELPFEVDVEFVGSLTVGFRWKDPTTHELVPPVRELAKFTIIRDTMNKHLLALEPYVLS